MATIKMGATVSDARGSVGGTVFSRNTGGAYTRARVAPINRRTAKQTQVRLNFATNSKQWSAALTADQRSAWTLFAQANPVPNRLGDSIILSGLAMFNRLNQVLAQIGGAPLLDAPPDLSVPELAQVVSISANAGTSLGLVTAAQAVVAGAKYYIFATGGLAPGRTPGTSDYRFMVAQAAVAAAVAIDITDIWSASFGSIPEAGSVGIKVARVNTTTGAVTPALVFNTQFD